MISLWLSLAAALLLLLCLPGSVYLFVLTLAAMRQRKADLPELAAEASSPLLIVVPAHNEAAGIARTVRNLSMLANRDGAAEVLVVADNCTDDTAVIARSLGARVLERHDDIRRGKGYALDFAFAATAHEHVDAYLVIDADSVADESLLPALRANFAAGAEALQVHYAVLNTDDSPRTRLMGLALAAFNGLRPRGREALGLSVGIFGNGFALRRSVLTRVPYAATSVVEDLEYHLRLVKQGIRVRFVAGAQVWGEMPVSAVGQGTQRARWEGGRLRMLREHGADLFLAVLRGQWRFLDPLADLLLLPLAYHSVLLLLLMAMPFMWAKLAALAGVLILFAHVFFAARQAGYNAGQLARIAWCVPYYVGWKLRMLASIWRSARACTPWQRTERKPS